MAQDDDAPSRSTAKPQKPAVPSFNQFLAAVTASGLVDEPTLAAHVASFRQEFEGAHNSANLARFLINRRCLTRYQAERLLAGRTEGFFLGGSKLLSKLGAGGMGQVYLAEQVRLGRLVALKVLPRQFAADPVFVARFHREARAVAALKHPNVVQIYDVGEERGIHYLVMEYIEGETLAARLNRDGVFPCDESIRLIRQIAVGLAHVHANGIVHRDIKPANLIVERGVAKILDLGLARQAEAGQQVTQSGQLFGTPDYMSPEQCTDARAADARSDLYSLGCTWFTMLTGRVLFPQESAVAKVMAHLHTPPPLDDLPASLPPKVRDLFARLLAKDPNDRPSSADALAAELDRIDSSAVASGLAQHPTPIPAAQVPTVILPAPAVADGPVADPTDPESLVQRPVAGVPAFLLYVLPTMAALVLGGAYFGIDALRRQVAQTEPVIIETKPVTVTQPVATELVDRPSASPSGPPPTAELAAHEPARPAVPDRSPDATPVAAPETGSSPDPSPIPADPPEPRPPQTIAVGSESEFERAWSTALDHDRLELPPDALMRLGSLSLEDKTLHVAAPGRATIIVDPTAGPDGLWRLDRSVLNLSGIDFYVVATDPTVLEALLINAVQSDVRLTGCSITVVSLPEKTTCEVTLVRMSGERSWDPQAGGDAPAAVRLEISDAIVRGPVCVAQVGSRQATVRLANLLIASPEVMLRLRHTAPVESAHHEIDVEVTDSTLDVAGPLVELETRPLQLEPALTTVTIRRSLIADGGPSAEPRPQILWASPVSTEVISRSLKWIGEANILHRRGPGLVAKTAAGPWATLVVEPHDWQSQGLGIDAETTLLSTPLKLPRTVYDRRLPRDYPTPSQLSRLRDRSNKEPAGADVRRSTLASWPVIAKKLEEQSLLNEEMP